MKKILIACEFSGIVRGAFIECGHDAISCDLLPTGRVGPHYHGDVRDLLGEKWDMILAPGENRSKIRSRIFPGIAAAMAAQ